MSANVGEQLVNPPESKPGGHSEKGDAGSNESLRIEVQKKCAHVSRLADQLERMLPGLPHLDEKSVVAPETEEQYALKEEAERELARGVEELKGCLPLLEKEVQRCMENQQRIQRDSTRLNCQEPKTSYSRAEGATKEQLFAAIGARDTTVAVLTRAQAALYISQKKKLPGKEPQRQFPFPGAKPGDMPRSSRSKGTHPPPEKLNEETAGLIDLGPLE